MGFSISWIAFEGIGKNEVLRRMMLRDTGEEVLPGEGVGAYSGAALTNGWFVLVAEDFAFAASDKTLELSAACRTIACGAEEHVMASYSQGVTDQKVIWCIEHEAQKGIFDLTVRGETPASFREIFDTLLARQESEGGQEAGVDYVFDAPIDAAKSLCGFRHDGMPPEGGWPVFTRLEAYS